MKRFIVFILCLIIALASVACKSNTQKQNVGNSNAGIKETDEECFIWSDTVITGLSEEGKKVENLVIPTKCTGFYDGAFREEMSIKSVQFASDDTELSKGLFAHCQKLTSIVLPSNITVIPKECFSDIGVSKISIPETVNQIDRIAFYMCENLVEVDLSNTKIQVLSEKAFASCKKLATVKLPETLIDIDEYAFQSCFALKDINFGDAIECINTRAFYQCDSLDSVVLPSSLKKIGYNAFALCKNLSEVKLSDELNVCDSTAFVKGTFEDGYVELSLLVKKGSATEKLIENVNFGNLVVLKYN